MSLETRAADVVFIVEDDPSVRTAIGRLIRSVGLQVQLFSSAQEFLRTERADVPACLVLDARLPGLSGLDLQQILVEQRSTVPIIFITGHGDIPMSVMAMKAGAVEFLTKPFQDGDLLNAIQQALERDRTTRVQRAEITALQRLWDSLTPREREVFSLVAHGLLNKQIAAQLGASEKTIKVHRGKVMRKMQAQSLADVVRMADKLGIVPAGAASATTAGQ